MITLTDLYEEASRFVRENYGIPLSIPISIAHITDDIQGAYLFTAEGPEEIVISEFALTYGCDEHIYDVLRHELIHFALHKLGRDHRDGDDDFENELERLGVGSSGTTVLGRYHLYRCGGCGDEIPSRQRFSEDRLRVIVTECCEMPAEDLREQAVYNGKERVY